MRKSSKPPLSPPLGTIFDDVYRTITQKLTILVIPAINEAFGTHYDERTNCEQLRNEHLELSGRIITDSIFRLGEKIYHLECQSTPDGTMAIRMFEYGFAIALDEARKKDSLHSVRFPMSAVIYLRHGKNMTDKLGLEVIFPDEQKIIYPIPVIKVQDYSLEEIFQKKLWLFLPYFIMRYEKEFDAMEHDAPRRAAMLATLRELRENLETAAKDSKFESIYGDLMELSTRIAEYMLRKQKQTKKEVSAIMGGKVLELRSERIIRKAKQAGRAEGEGRLSRLISLLLKGGKTKEAAAAAEDSEVRKRLYKEYGIV